MEALKVIFLLFGPLLYLMVWFLLATNKTRPCFTLSIAMIIGVYYYANHLINARMGIGGLISGGIFTVAIVQIAFIAAIIITCSLGLEKAEVRLKKGSCHQAFKKGRSGGHCHSRLASLRHT